MMEMRKRREGCTFGTFWDCSEKGMKGRRKGQEHELAYKGHARSASRNTQH